MKKLFECPQCGNLREAEDWVYCSIGHKEAAMYEVITWGRDGRERLEKFLAEKNKAKNAA